MSEMKPTVEVIEIGDDVDMPEPLEGDSWNNTFTGRMVECDNEGIATVIDCEDNAYQIDIFRLYDNM